jgi:mRNA-degrading endonuclease RelE of RelBE toxin-antitoxin system
MDKWIIDDASKEEVFCAIKHKDVLVGKWSSFESDVTDNPFYHPKAKRIVKLKGKTSFPPGTYRYRKDPLRVIYFPDKSTQTVYPLEAASATDISYKKRTKGR